LAFREKKPLREENLKNPMKRFLIRPFLSFIPFSIIHLFFIRIGIGGPIKGYPVILEMTTNSDWLEIQFKNVSFHYQGDTVLLRKGEGFNYGILSLWKRQYDSSLVSIRFQIFLPEKLPPKIQLLGRKGAIGEARIVLLTQKEETLAHFGFKEMEKEFIFPQTVFRQMKKETYSPARNNKNIEKKVLAFYYPWYNKDNWFLKGKKVVSHIPLLGFYSSSEPKVLREHILWAKGSGIDGFIVSWWKRDSETDSNLMRLVPLCESLGFQFTIYLEEANSLSDLESTLSYLGRTYGKSPAFFRVNGRPVCFLFRRIFEKLSLDTLKLASRNSPFLLISYGYTLTNLEGFAGFHQYLPDSREVYLRASEVARAKNKFYAVPVMPGYDDRALREPGHFTDREKGNFYRKNWESALASDPDWILITSFNEWFEGTEIEPSVEYGDLYLRLTAHYAKLFKEGKR
jgi:hypothetical protein